MREWEAGSSFTCEATHNKNEFTKTISICQIHTHTHPSIHIEIPSFMTVMKATSEVMASCSVRTVFDAKVTWLMDGKLPSSNKVKQTRNGTHLIATLTVSTRQWKQLRLVKCKAEHRCLSSAEKSIHFSEPAATAPSVEIRRYLPDLLKGNSAVLECDVTQLSSTDLYITFQADSVDISDKLYVDLPETPGLHSISRRFTVLSRYWNNDTSFTCTVNQGYNRKFTSNSTGNFFVDPSMELLLVPSEVSGPQRLSCSGWGFNPQIKWFSESTQRSSSKDDISMDADGRVAVTSQLQIPQTEWKTGKVFTCKVSDRSLDKTVEKDISLCSAYSSVPPSIHVEIPSFKTVMMSTSEVQATCLVRTDFNAEVTWLMDGTAAPSSQVKQAENTTHILSEVKVSSNKWKQLKFLTCRAVHTCFSSTERTVSVAEPAATAPSVEIRRSLPDLLKGNSAVLECGVTQLSSTDLYVTFQANSVHISEKQYVNLPQASGLHSISRRFTVPQKHWKKDTSFTCTVNQGFSSNFQSNSTGNIFVDPSVELLLVPSEVSGPQRLSCSGRGFNPQIKWFSESTQRSSSNNDISMGADGRVAVTSQLQIPQAEWKTGKVFTCEVSDKSLNKQVRQDISLCSACSSVPPSIHVEIPSFETVMMSTSEVQATCLVSTSFDAKVTWLMDGRVSHSNTVSQNKNTTHVFSDVRVSSSQWKQLKHITCRAEHACFSLAEKTISVAEPAATAPSVEIRRSLPDLLKGNSAVLECDVTQLSSTDLYVTFQANSVHISEKQYVNLPQASGLHSISRRFTVPQKHWKKDTSFTCTVNQGFSSNFQSNSTGNIFVDPSVELLLVPSEVSGPQRLSCSGRGFNPQIKWFSESKQRSSSNNDISMGADGRVAVTSQLQIPQTEWKTGKVFTCEVSDKSLNKQVRQDISLCSAYSSVPPSIHVEIPSFKTVMMSTSEVQATCLVRTDFNAEVTWLMDGTAAPSSQVKQAENTTHILSEVKVSSNKWKQLKFLTCRAVHTCFSSTERTVSVAEPAATAPSVEIRRSLPDLLKGNSAVLECDVTQLSSTDLYVTFQANSVHISEKQYVNLPQASGLHSISRRFTVPQKHWKKDTSFTCTVNQGFSSNFQSNSTGNIFVDPSVELLLVPSEVSGPQRLSCSGWGFNPQIKWFSESKQRFSSKDDISMGADGCVAVTSQLQIPQAEWKTGKVFMCEVSDKSLNKQVRQDISLCSACSSVPPSIHVEIPSFETVMMSTSEVQATCLVSTSFDAKVTWLMDGRVSHSNTVSQNKNTTHVFSDVRVSSSQWKQLKHITCRAEHACFSLAEKTISVAEPAATAPSVEIRRSLPDLLKGNSAVLECDVTQLSSTDLYVTFQANSVHISEKQYVNLPQASGLHSISRRFTVPQKHWKKDTSFTCTVNQGFSSNFQSNSTGNIFVDPSVELLLVPSEVSGPQRLSCSGRGFNPQIKWFSESKQRSSSNNDISMGADGRVAVTSQLQIPQTEWKTGKVFTCEVSDKSLNKQVRQDISLCSAYSSVPPSIHVEIPSFKTVMMSTSEVQAMCLVRTDFNAEVTWLMDGTAAPSSQVKQAENTTHILSEVKVSSNKWKQLKFLTCRAVHTCFSSTERTVSVAEPAATAPSVEIRRSLPDLLKGNSAVLECDVTQLSSTDLYVTFQANSVHISEKQYVNLPQASGLHSISRRFTVPQKHWKKDTSFTCTVNQGFSSNFQSNSTGNIFVDPSVELLLVPSEVSGPQRLSCSGWGFNPQIKWFSESKQRFSSKDDISMGADGRVAVTSQLQIPQAEWKTGKVFMCEVSDKSLNKQVRKDISLCSAYSSVPPSIHVEIPSFETVMMSTSEVQATCLVSTSFDAKVTWLMDGRVSQSNTVSQNKNTTHVFSDVRVSSSQWKQLKHITCRAEHACFSLAEKTISVAEPAATAPSVEIRRSLPDLLKGNSAVLECDVTQLSSTDLYVTFQANSVHISEKQYVNLPQASGLHSISRRFTVPQKHWKKDTSFTCTVNQGFSSNFQSNSTGNIFVDPSVELLLVPSEVSGPQRLSCSGRGFNPQIKWFSESKQRSSSNNDISMGADGRVAVTSQLQIPQTEWKTGKVFTCEVSDKSLNKQVRQDISLCSAYSSVPPSIHVEIPSFETVMMSTSEVQATCLVSTSFDAKVTWLTDGRVSHSNTVSQNKNTTHVFSDVRVSSSQWKQLKHITCRAEHACFSLAEKTISVAEPAATAPSVEIRRSLPDLLKGNSAVLECDVTQLSSTDLYVTFQANSVHISEKQYVDLPQASGLHSISRRFTVPQKHWKKDTSFTCTVNQGFSSNFQSNSTGNIFVDPSVELLLVPSEVSGPQRLSCSGRGFNPQIKWFSESKQRSSSNDDISMGADGRVAVTSQLQIPQTEWKTGKVFTCEVSDKSLNKQVRQDISLCSAYSSVPPSIHVEIPSFETVMIPTSEVQATCLVSTGFDAKVTWLMDGRVSQSNTVSQNKNTTHVFSDVRVSSSQWKQLKHITCRAEHACFSLAEKTISVAEPAATAPSVEIRRSLPDLLKGNSAVLECDVTQLSSTDLYVTFQANSVHISEKQYVNLPQASGLHSISRRFTVPQKHWKKDTSFTCTVNQGFSSNFQSNSTGNIFVDPSVELLLVPSEVSGPQRLSCSGRGFNPQIKWFSESKQRSSSNDDISMGADGRVAVTSQLQIPQTEWKTGKVFTCEVSDKSLNKQVRQDISLCSAYSSVPPSIHVEIPSFETVMIPTSEVQATCLVSTGFDAKVTWLMDGRVSQSNTVSQNKNTTHVFSDVRVSSSQWKQLKHITCRAEHACFSLAEKTISVAEPAATAPSVEIRRSLPDLLKGNSAVLECDVTQLSSTDLYVTFQANSVHISEKQYVNLPQASGLHSISRRFTVPQKHWKKDTSFTCTVNQGFSSNFQSNSTGNIFVDPSVELLLVPSEVSGPQRLSCSGRGFNPQIKWFSESKQRSSSNDDISMGADGRVAVTSQLQIPQTEWKTGKVFTCEVSDKSLNKQVRQDISLCSAYSSFPPSIHVEIPSFKTVMMSTSEVQATCLVSTSFDAKVTWLMDGRVSHSNTVSQNKNTTHVFSDVRVSSSQWKQLKHITCRAEHACFSLAEKTISVAEPAATAPSVEIRRSLPDLLKGNSAVLECDVTQLSSTDLYVTFQANSVHISEKQYVNLPQASGLHSISRRFTVPQKHWKKDTSFTCTVNQGFSSNFQSNSTGNIFVDPSVDLLLVPSEVSGPQRLSCSGRGFNPQIKWFSESKQRSSSNDDISMGADGRVAVTSQLQIPQTEWKTGKVFTCEVSDKSLNKQVRQDISVCSVHTHTHPSIHIEIPSFMTVMKATSEVMASCSVRTVFDAKVTWLMDGRLPFSNKMKQTRNGTHLIGTLTVSTRQWKQLRLVKCKAEHRCLSSAEKSIHFSEPAATAPSVEIRRSLPDLLKGNSAVLECGVTQLSSTDLYVTFQANSVHISEKQYVNLPQASGLHSISRRFTVPQKHWKKDTSFTCTVNQGFSSNFQSNSTGNIFVDPSVELLLVPSEVSGPQRLSCSGRGFNPQIKWFSESTQRSSSNDDISMGADGRVAVTSQLQIPQAEWKTGKVFTCEVSDKSLNKQVRQDISVCSAYSSFPPSIHVEIPSFETVMMSTSEVQATCLVSTSFDAKVTWLMDGRVSQSNTVSQNKNTTHVFSDVRVSSSQWKQLKHITCRAEHACFSLAEKTISVAEPAATAPSVEIRRSLPDLLKGNSAVLECDVTQLSSTDLYVTFQANSVHISEKQYVNLPQASGLHSISRRFTVPQKHWKKDTSFTCTVNQGFSSNFQSNSTGNIFVDPSVELLLVPSEVSGPQTLSCSGRGFNPQIKWFSESTQRSSSNDDISMGADGRVAVTSQLQIPQTEWKTGKVFTCEVSDKSLNKQVRQDISLCSACSSVPPSIHVEIPSFETVMMSTSEVQATCLVSTSFDAKVTWLMDGRVSQSNTVSQNKNTTHVFSDVRVSSSQWKQLKHITCRAEHACFSLAEKTISVAVDIYMSATLSVLASPDEENQASFSCFAKDFSPKSYKFKWLKNDADITNKIDEIVTPSKERQLENGTKVYSAASFLLVESSEWTPDTKFTCLFEGTGENNPVFVNSSVTHNKEISIQPVSECPEADVEITIIGPTMEDMFLNRKGKLECRAQENKPSITEMKFENEDGKDLLGTGMIQVKGNKKTYSISIDISYDEWSRGIKSTCVVTHSEHIDPLKEVYERSFGGKLQRPSVFMMPPVEHTRKETVTLTCYVKDFSPKEVYVSWLVDDDASDTDKSVQTTNPIENSGSYSAYGQLTVSLEQWKQNDKVYSCAVYHESVANTTRAIVRSIGYRAFGNTNLVNLNMNVPDTCKAQ
ncbi:uncharacterized protein [Pagrus major]|uniref:uncharacterized protein n=1 Tax=Pagrus major TaxID=143350 RepID=UPI003CC88859